MTVELIDSMGSDLSIVNAARVSYHKSSHVLSEADRGLIRFLARNRHGTPFEMVYFTFRMRFSIGVEREHNRHRIASINEESTRYVEMRPDFYVPKLEHVRVQVGKPGNYSFEAASLDLAAEFVADLKEQYQRDYAFYQKWIRRGVAKELARIALPLGLLTELIWTVNLRSLFNYLSLRTAPNALLEIRLEAAQVESLIRPIVPVAMDAWEEGGRLPI